MTDGKTLKEQLKATRGVVGVGRKADGSFRILIEWDQAQLRDKLKLMCEGFGCEIRTKEELLGVETFRGREVFLKTPSETQFWVRRNLQRWAEQRAAADAKTVLTMLKHEARDKMAKRPEDVIQFKELAGWAKQYGIKKQYHPYFCLLVWDSLKKFIEEELWAPES